MERLFWVIIVGLVLPWLGLIWLWIKAPRETLVIAPFASMLGFIITCLGAQFELFILLPRYDAITYPALFVDLGLYPMTAAAAIYFIHHLHRSPSWVLPAMAAFLTLLEAFGLSIHWVYYSHGWNMLFTFISYLLPALLVYAYYQWLLSLRILEHRWEFSHRRFRK